MIKNQSCTELKLHNKPKQKERIPKWTYYTEAPCLKATQYSLKIKAGVGG